MAVQRGGGAVARGAAERILVGDVPGRLEHDQVVGEAFRIGAQPQAEGGGHGHLQVRIARQQHVLQLLGLLLQEVEQGRDLADGPLQAGAREQLDVHGYLVVAGAPGMDLLPYVAEGGRQPGFHLRVDVFALDGEPTFHGLVMEFFQFWKQHGELVLPKQPHFREHRDMRHRAEDVPRREHQVQFPVLSDRERVDLRRIIESF